MRQPMAGSRGESWGQERQRWEILSLEGPVQPGKETLLA